MSEKHIKAEVEVYRTETGIYLPLSEDERIFLAVTFWFWLKHDKQLYNPKKTEHVAWYLKIINGNSIFQDLVFSDSNALGAFTFYLFSGYALGLNGLQYRVVMNGEKSGRQEYQPRVTLNDENYQMLSLQDAMTHLFP